MVKIKFANYVKWILLSALIFCFLFFSSKAGGLWLTAMWEKSTEKSAPAISVSLKKVAQAIVVLTGGNSKIAEVARIYQITGLPVLASGGDGEAVAIKANLEGHFHVPVKWTEINSLNTKQNALFSAKILMAENIQTIILVTHASHIPRARIMFLDQGIQVIAAPTNFSNDVQLKWRDYFPSATGQNLTKSVAHEVFGILWYLID